uniref:Cell division protein FTSH n=1 Tax=Dichotomosiphon tuberosus TaxID=118263 RepID=A0A386AWU2_9CHLO|nr:Cell division protein FTSH [Dichotomosiphon tuberosus]
MNFKKIKIYLLYDNFYFVNKYFDLIILYSNKKKLNCYNINIFSEKNSKYEEYFELIYNINKKEIQKNNNNFLFKFNNYKKIIFIYNYIFFIFYKFFKILKDQSKYIISILIFFSFIINIINYKNFIINENSIFKSLNENLKTFFLKQIYNNDPILINEEFYYSDLKNTNPYLIIQNKYRKFYFNKILNNDSQFSNIFIPNTLDWFFGNILQFNRHSKILLIPNKEFRILDLIPLKIESQKQYFSNYKFFLIPRKIQKKYPILFFEKINKKEKLNKYFFATFNIKNKNKNNLNKNNFYNEFLNYVDQDNYKIQLKSTFETNFDLNTQKFVVVEIQKDNVKHYKIKDKIELLKRLKKKYDNYNIKNKIKRLKELKKKYNNEDILNLVEDIDIKLKYTKNLTNLFIIKRELDQFLKYFLWKNLFSKYKKYEYYYFQNSHKAKKFNRIGFYLPESELYYFLKNNINKYLKKYVPRNIRKYIRKKIIIESIKLINLIIIIYNNSELIKKWNYFYDQFLIKKKNLFHIYSISIKNYIKKFLKFIIKKRIKKLKYCKVINYSIFYRFLEYDSINFKTKEYNIYDLILYINIYNKVTRNIIKTNKLYSALKNSDQYLYDIVSILSYKKRLEFKNIELFDFLKYSKLFNTLFMFDYYFIYITSYLKSHFKNFINEKNKNNLYFFLKGIFEQDKLESNYRYGENLFSIFFKSLDIDDQLFVKNTINKKFEKTNDKVFLKEKNKDQILLLLNNINSKINFNYKDNFRVRRMSGYLYPDFKMYDIYSYFYNKIILINFKSLKNTKLQKKKFIKKLLKKKKSKKKLFFADTIFKVKNLRIDSYSLYKPFLNFNDFSFLKNSIYLNIAFEVDNPKLFFLKDNINLTFFPFFEHFDNFFNYTKVNTIFLKIINKYRKLKSENLKSNYTRLTQYYNLKSFLFTFKVGLFLIFFNLIKNMYIRNNKEIFISFIKFLKFIGIIKDLNWIKYDLKLNLKNKNYKNIKSIEQKLETLTGVNNFLFNIIKIIIYLRSTKYIFMKLIYIILYLLKEFHIIKSIKPKAFLLIGPPGTGKTLFVKSIAGESEVPILIQSGSLFKSPLKKNGANSIYNIFKRARQISPCILFLDEVDNLGMRRHHINLNIVESYETDELVDFFDTFPLNLFYNLKVNELEEYEKIVSNFEQDKIDEYKQNIEKDDDLYESIRKQKIPINIKVLKQTKFNTILRHEQLRLLTQLLIELDGLNLLDNIVIIGATNRFNILDPALLRPGRFKELLYFNLPDNKKRILLLNYYLQNNNFEKYQILDYFVKRTNNFSYSDISSIINSSNFTNISFYYEKHSIYSLERGIDLITSDPYEKNIQTLSNFYKIFNINIKNNVYILNLYKFSNISKYNINNFSFTLNQLIGYKYSIIKYSYYYIGKIFISFYLKNKEILSFINIVERSKNFRYHCLNSIFEIFNINTNNLIYKKKFEEIFINLISGKASELLFIFFPIIDISDFYFYKNKKNVTEPNIDFNYQSNIGSFDLKKSITLLSLIIEKWYIYNKIVSIDKINLLNENKNNADFNEYGVSFGEFLIEDNINKLDTNNNILINIETFTLKSWWQKQLFLKNKNINYLLYLKWFRINIYEINRNEQNIEWIPADIYYHSKNIQPKNFLVNWNDYLSINENLFCNDLLLNKVNKIVLILREFGELIDFFVDYLIRNDIIREYEFRDKIELYYEIMIKNKINLKIISFRRYKFLIKLLKTIFQ